MIKQITTKKLIVVIMAAAAVLCMIGTAASATAAKKIKSKSVSLSTEAVTLAKGDIVSLTAAMSPKNSTDSLTWTSSNKKVAKVSKTGVVTAVAEGTATITVKTSSKKKASCKITVKEYLTKEESDLLTRQEIMNLIYQYGGGSSTTYVSSVSDSHIKDVVREVLKEEGLIGTAPTPPETGWKEDEAKSSIVCEVLNSESRELIVKVSSSYKYPTTVLYERTYYDSSHVQVKQYRVSASVFEGQETIGNALGIEGLPEDTTYTYVDSVTLREYKDEILDSKDKLEITETKDANGYLSEIVLKNNSEYLHLGAMGTVVYYDENNGIIGTAGFVGTAEKNQSVYASITDRCNTDKPDAARYEIYINTLLGGDDWN